MEKLLDAQELLSKSTLVISTNQARLAENQVELVKIFQALQARTIVVVVSTNWSTQTNKSGGEL